MAARAPEVVWSPNSEPQKRFLAASDFEVLYGGAAGGGKTQAMMVAALGLFTWTDDKGRLRHAIEHPRYEALITRKFAKDVSELIRVGKEIYNQVLPDVVWKQGDQMFVFPSGATIELGGIPVVGDEERYKSRSFQFVGWEELTEHESKKPYNYLISRVRPGNRMPADFPCYVRSTTNPDGPGQVWVKERFRITDDGEDVPSFEAARAEVAGKTYVFTRQFIRALAQDNPDLDNVYTARFALMSDQRAQALRDGWWGAPNIEGAIFRDQFVRISEENRITKVPHQEGYPVNTFWDLGVNDRQAIWFHQQVGRAHHFIGYYENSHKPLRHYYDLLKEVGDKQGYMYGRHYLPHDADHVRQHAEDTRSIREILEDMGLRPIEVVPRIGSINEGLELARQALRVCYFDEKDCSRGIDMLRVYRYRFDPKTGTTTRKPLHNEASNAADAFRQFAQSVFENPDMAPAAVDPVNEPLGVVAKRRFRMNADVETSTDWIV